jgi:hypothetical protein
MSRPAIIDEQLDVLDALDSSHHSGGAQGDESNAPLLIQKWSEVGALNLPVGEQIIHELERGELAMLAAVTNVGKSTLLRNLAYHWPVAVGIRLSCVAGRRGACCY